MAAEAIEKINTIAEEACQRIEKIIPMLQTSVDHFTDATFKNLFWYENAELFYKLSFSVLATRSNAYQLLALEPNELVEVLDWDHVGSDMERYLAYVRRIIPEATRREMTSDEVLEARLDPPVHPTDNEAFIENAFQLIQVLVDCSRDKDALHVLVLLKSSIRVSYARMQDGRLAEHHALLNSAIRAFVAKCPLDEGAESKLYIRENFVDIMVNGLTWRQQSDSGRRHTWYWDFAAAKRHLNGAYFDTWCYDRVPEDRILHNNVEYDSRSDCCFHSASLGLLDWLQTKAWSEIRYNVFCTAGSKLPTSSRSAYSNTLWKLKGLMQTPD